MSHFHWHRGSEQDLLHPKKVGALPVVDDENVKRTNEIKTAIPLLDAIDIQGKDITADALLTQCKIATYLVDQRNAHYHFTVKNNQPGLFQDIALYFKDRPDRNPQNLDYNRTQRLSELSSRRTSFSHPTGVHR